MTLGGGRQTPEEGRLVRRHLWRCRLLWGVFLVTVPAAAVIGFFLPHLEPGGASPSVLTVLAFAASLWITLTADRDATRRLERIRRAYVAHGELGHLLRDHFLVILVVLLRLEVVVALSLVVALWGWGGQAGLWVAVLAGVMIALAWPTPRKVALLIHRARHLRGGE